MLVQIFLPLFPFVIVHMSACEAELFQLNRSRTLCTGEEAVFLCSNNDGPFVHFVITTLTGFQGNMDLHTIFNHNDSTIIDSTVSIDAEITVSNASFYISFLTLTPPVNSTIRCNNETVTYQLQNYSYYLPTHIILKLQANSSKYLISWIPDWSAISRYLMTINSSSFYWSTEVSSITPIELDFNESARHSMTVSFLDCPHLHKKTFELDCLLSPPVPFEDFSYAKISAGSFTAQVKCKTSDSTINWICSDGSWQNSNETSCTTKSYLQTEYNDLNYSQLSKIIQTDSENITLREATFLPIVIILVSSIASFAFIVFIGVVIITSALLAAALTGSLPCKKKKITKSVKSNKQYEPQDSHYQTLDHSNLHAAPGVNHNSIRLYEPAYSTLNNYTNQTLPQTLSKNNSQQQLQQNSNTNHYSTLNTDRCNKDFQNEETQAYCTNGATSTEIQPETKVGIIEESETFCIPPPIPPQRANIMEGIEVPFENNF